MSPNIKHPNYIPVCGEVDYFSKRYKQDSLFNDPQSLAMFDNSKLFVILFIRTLKLPFIKTNLISVVVSILRYVHQKTAWLTGSTETYYIKVKGFEPLMQYFFFLIWSCFIPSYPTWPKLQYLCKMHGYHQKKSTLNPDVYFLLLWIITCCIS